MVDRAGPVSANISYHGDELVLAVEDDENFVACGRLRHHGEALRLGGVRGKLAQALHLADGRAIGTGDRVHAIPEIELERQLGITDGSGDDQN
jgi:hypothetical protein